MTKIDIDRLSEAELVDLHHRIVERLRFLEQMRAHALTRYNKRTVTVITDNRRQWNVSPGFLRRVARPDTAEATSTNVIRLK